jgi:hypothetical protein
MRLCGFEVGLDKPLFLIVIAGRRGLGGCGAPGASSGAEGWHRKRWQS